MYTVFSVTYVEFLKYSSIKKKSSPSDVSEYLSLWLLLISQKACDFKGFRIHSIGVFEILWATMFLNLFELLLSSFELCEVLNAWVQVLKLVLALIDLNTTPQSIIDLLFLFRTRILCLSHLIRHLTLFKNSGIIIISLICDFNIWRKQRNWIFNI